METNFDLFGNPVEEKTSLRDNFIEPPFTVLDARGGYGKEEKTGGVHLASVRKSVVMRWQSTSAHPTIRMMTLR